MRLCAALLAAYANANADAARRGMQAWTDRLDDSHWWIRRHDHSQSTARTNTAAPTSQPEAPPGQGLVSIDLAETSSPPCKP